MKLFINLASLTLLSIFSLKQNSKQAHIPLLESYMFVIALAILNG
jgi:hypothetical protein